METQNKEHNKGANIKEVKALRKEMDNICQRIKEVGAGGDTYTQNPQDFQKAKETALQKSQETVMWLSMTLKAIGANNLYPDIKIEPTADDLKM